MRSSLGAKRQPKKIGHDSDDDGGEDIKMGEDTAESEEPKGVVVRPPMFSQKSKQKRNRSFLRTSFGPTGTSMIEDDDEPTKVFTPKKSMLSRQALGKNALRKSHPASITSEQIPHLQTEDRPKYNADTLNELRSSTPSTPKEIASKTDIDPEPRRELDLAAKFGSNLALQTNSAIPTDAEVREKRQRRARMAKEQDFINLDEAEDDQEVDGDSQESDDERSLLPYAQPKSSKREETRLVRDDEDFAEGFEEFVEDGRIVLGRKAEKEQKKRHEAEMRAMIEDAEGGSGSDGSSEDESEIERRAAYEAAQTRAGMDGLKKEDRGAQPRRPRTPPRITPLPTLADIGERLEAEIARKLFAKEQKVKQLEEVKKELADIAARKVEVQRLLNEAAENYQRLRVEAGIDVGLLEGLEQPRVENGVVNGIEELRAANQGGALGMGLGMGSRGLENLGGI